VTVSPDASVDAPAPASPAATASSPPVRTSTFVKVLAIMLTVVAGLGLLIHFLNGAHHRPEGIAEHWLSAVGDTGRKGVSADARRRAARIGPMNIATPLLPAGHHDHRLSYFSGLEVGKARVSGSGVAAAARVPFRLHQQVDSGTSPTRKGTLVLDKSGDTWRVAALDSRRPDERVASEGGPPPSRAPIGVWIGALLVGLFLAVLSSFITRWAERSARLARAVPA
jgi:hypothetical protein